MGRDLATSTYRIKTHGEHGLYLDAQITGDAKEHQSIVAIADDHAAAPPLWYLKRRTEDGLWVVSTGGFDGAQAFAEDAALLVSHSNPRHGWEIHAVKAHKIGRQVYTVKGPEGKAWFVADPQAAGSVVTLAELPEETADHNPDPRFLFHITHHPVHDAPSA